MSIENMKKMPTKGILSDPDTYISVPGTMTVNLGNNSVSVHDGKTPGGQPLIKVLPITPDQFASPTAAMLADTRTFYELTTTKDLYRSVNGALTPVTGVSGIVMSTGALTTSTLIKTGPAKVFNLLITSGAGYITLRDGTTIGGALLPGWGAGGTGGISTGSGATVNVPYAPSTAPTNFVNGLYAEVSGTVTYIVYYQ